MDDLLNKNILGQIRAHSATIEWQKRGLTHAHILIIIKEGSKPRTREEIDGVVHSEIPDKEKNPLLHSVITSNNIHGHSTAYSVLARRGMDKTTTAPKDFPKLLPNSIILGNNSFPEYRWRTPNSVGNTHTIKKGSKQEQTIDNRWLVPYNPFLSVRHQAHINVEVVYSVDAVKYLQKYICK